MDAAVKSDEMLEFDTGRHDRAKLGFVVLAMEQTVEDDVFALTPPGVGVHFARITMSNDATVETLAAMEPDIEQAASLLLPDAKLDALCYTCNSGTMVIGEDKVMATLKRASPDAQPTTVMTGVWRALKALDARKIAVATPYAGQVNDFVRAFLEGHGFEIVSFKAMEIVKNSDIDRVTPASIRDFAARTDHDDADALFVCCGALRALDVADQLEKQVAKPVVTSNQAMMWDCLRLAGIDDALKGYGRLLTLPG
jgi:maleate isomerase